MRLFLAHMVFIQTVAGSCGGTVLSPPVSRDDRLGAWVPNLSATILRATHSGLTNRWFVMVEDRPTWQELWAETWKGTLSPPSLPFVDFVLASVVVVAAGQRGSDHSVTIDSVVTFTSGGIVFATEVQPGAGCTPGTGTSAPVHMVHMPGHPPILEWRVSSGVRVCP